MRRRARLIAVVAIVAAGLLGVASSTQTWLVAIVRGAAVTELAVPGATAVPLLAPLSLAVLALGLALSIAGVVLRYAFGVLGIAAGVVLIIACGRVLVMEPTTSVASAVTDATGITGTDAVAELVGTVTPTPWPVVTLAGWLVLVGAAVFTVVTARRWRGPDRRYRIDATADPPASDSAARLDAVDSWDGLSRGEDPTAGSRPR